jgi:hypothetical protein
MMMCSSQVAQIGQYVDPYSVASIELNRPETPKVDIELVPTAKFTGYVCNLKNHLLLSKAIFLYGYPQDTLVQGIEYRPKTKEEMQAWCFKYHQQYLQYLQQIEKYNLANPKKLIIPKGPIHWGNVLSCVAVKIQMIDDDASHTLYTRWIEDDDPDYKETRLLCDSLQVLWQEACDVYKNQKQYSGQH